MFEDMEFQINCKHFDISTRCNHPNMKFLFGLFRKKCITWNRLKPCEIQEKIVDKKMSELINTYK